VRDCQGEAPELGITLSGLLHVGKWRFRPETSIRAGWEQKAFACSPSRGAATGRRGKPAGASRMPPLPPPPFPPPPGVEDRASALKAQTRQTPAEAGDATALAIRELGATLMAELKGEKAASGGKEPSRSPEGPPGGSIPKDAGGAVEWAGARGDRGQKDQEDEKEEEETRTAAGSVHDIKIGIHIQLDHLQALLRKEYKNPLAFQVVKNILDAVIEDSWVLEDPLSLAQAALAAHGNYKKKRHRKRDKRRKSSGHRDKRSESEDSRSSSSSARLPSAGKLENKVRGLARSKPGALALSGLQKISEYLRHRGNGAVSQTLCDARVEAYLTQVLKVSADIHVGTEREMRSLAMGIDLLLSGRVSEATDLLFQRFKSREMAAAGHPWQVCTQLELIPDTAVTAVTEWERSAIHSLRAEELRLTHFSEGKGGQKKGSLP
jgi:hypothetical protein